MAEAEPLRRARTVGEALLYLRVRGATVQALHTMPEGGAHRVSIDATHDGAARRFDFLVRQPEHDPSHLGGGAPSTLLDPVDLTLFASRIAREEAARDQTASPDALRARLADLVLAAEAADEALKFIARRAVGIEAAAATTTAARWLLERTPERFTRAAIGALGDLLRSQAIAVQRALPGA